MAARDNKSYFYVFPMIADKINYTKNLLGCYIGDVDRPDITNKILLRYKFDGHLSDGYLKFEKELENSALCSEIYDIKDGRDNTVMFVFHVPENYKMDYEHFMHSRYSKFSQEYKQKIINYHGTTEGKRNILEGILYKKEEYRKKVEEKINERIPPDQEVASSWYPEKEIFKKEDYHVIQNNESSTV